MPQQLIYTSAPRGVVAGRSGYCTVARSTTMRDALALQLEKLSYYQHLSLSGGSERPICAYRIVDIRGSRFHVLTRIQDAGLDFTGRTNFVAHHVALTPEELRQFSTPPVVLRNWPRWVKSWMKEPELFERESWDDMAALAGKSSLPAQTWLRVTGDAANGFGLLDARPGSAFLVDSHSDDEILELLAESLELLEMRDARRDFCAAAWQFTFTTFLQEHDNPGDFRWRMLHSDSPAFARQAGGGCPALSDVRTSRPTSEEVAFAANGWEAPRSVELRIDRNTINEGDAIRLTAKADGSPAPGFRWFELLQGQRIELQGRSGSILEEQPQGRAKRYLVEAFNRAGSQASNVVELSINAPLRVSSQRPSAGDQTVRNQGGFNSSAAKPGGSRANWPAEPEPGKERRKDRKLWVGILFVGVAATAGALALMRLEQTGGKLPVSTVGPPPPASRDSANEQSTNVLAPPVQQVDRPVMNLSSAPTDTLGLTRAQPDTDGAQSTSLTNASPAEPLGLGNLAAVLPVPWRASSIGPFEKLPSATCSNSQFHLTATGTDFFESAADNFLFVWERKNATAFEACLRQTREEPGYEPYAEYGIMMRESIASNAPFVCLGLGSDSLWLAARDQTGQSAHRQKIRSLKIRPVYMRLTRTGDVFECAYATNDVESGGKTEWIPCWTNDAPWPLRNCIAGLAVCSGKANEPASADFAMVASSLAKKTR